MLDVAFIHLISTGLDKLIRPVGEPAPHGGPSELIPALMKLDPTATGQLVSRCVENLWQGCQAVGITAEIAEPYVDALPAIIAGARLTAGDRQTLLGPPQDHSDTKLGELAQRLIDQRPIEDDTVELDETVLGYLLECFLQSLADARALINALPRLPREPSNQAHASRLTPQPLTPPVTTLPADAPKPTEANRTLAKIERADALGIPVPLLDLITVALINLFRSPAIRQADILAAAANAKAIDQALTELINTGHTLSTQSENGYIDELPAQAVSQFRIARLGECDRTLAAMEDELMKRAAQTSPPAAGLTNTTIQIRTIRAQMHALTGAYVKAARHYGFAQRYVSRSNMAQRWTLAALEVHNYELSVSHGGSADGLGIAARTCSSVLAELASQDVSAKNQQAAAHEQIRAKAQSELGHLLILIGEQENEPARFELAAQLLEDAEATQRQHGDLMASWDTTVLRADALARLGEASNSTALLETAAHLYQSALVNLTTHAGNSTTNEHEALTLRARLALTISSIAALNNDSQSHDNAMIILSDVLPIVSDQPITYGQSGLSHQLLLARCQMQLATWYRDQNEVAASVELLRKAAAHYEAAGMPERAANLRDNPASDPAEQLNGDRQPEQARNTGANAA